jgi:carbonic anhydrase
MKASDKLLLNNKSWAQERKMSDPEFFKRLARNQQPEFLWIGCSDSRVPANQITGTDAGEIFVHRNIANLFVPNDANVLTVLAYAVSVLKVKHVIVCGHHGCGGVRAAMSDDDLGDIGKWLSSIREIYAANPDQLHSLPIEERANRLCELSVLKQIQNLCETPIIRQAWATGGGPILHGWVYGMSDGILRELASAGPEGTTTTLPRPTTA